MQLLLAWSRLGLHPGPSEALRIMVISHLLQPLQDPRITKGGQEALWQQQKWRCEEVPQATGALLTPLLDTDAWRELAQRSAQPLISQDPRENELEVSPLMHGCHPFREELDRGQESVETIILSVHRETDIPFAWEVTFLWRLGD